jgi:ATP-binding cassette subfamily B protein/subfamily B ATP-binding cassette protein MsbA
MKNFLRALRFSLPYRRLLIVSVICATLAAVFWGLNFTAIYPILKVLGTDQNMQEWVDEKISETNARIEGVPEKNIEGLEAKLNKMSEEEKRLDSWPEGNRKEREKTRMAEELVKVSAQLEEARTELYHYRIYKYFIDRLVPGDRFQTLLCVVILVVIAVAIKGIFEFGQESLVGSVVNRSLYDMRNRLYRKTLHLDMQAFGEQGSAETLARLTNDMELLGAGQKTLFGKLVAEPLRALSCVVVALWINWQLTMMFLLLVPVAGFLLSHVGRMIKKATRRLLERMSNIYKLIQDSFHNIRVVKAFAREPYERRRFRVATKEYFRRAMQVVNLDAASGPVMEVLGSFVVAGALLMGAYLVLQKNTHIFGIRMTAQPLEAMALLQLYVVLAAIADPVRKLSNVYTRLQSGAAAADRIFALLDRQPRIRVNSEGQRLSRHGQAIEFRDVCFTYDQKQPVLSNINLTVRYGETIAIVGKNGSGKTTLLNLIPRFIDPHQGSIIIDGKDIRDVHLRCLRRQIAMVTQEAILFDDSIFNNIAYGKRRATREEVEAAAIQAGAHEFIVQKPEGYESRVGESMTVQMSGGQKQRIALARAILRNPSILILDEFTSQQDAESEASILRAMREFLKQRTTFVITHRLNTLEIADRIIVFERGRIAAVGTHKELLVSSPAYLGLHEAQSQRLCA